MTATLEQVDAVADADLPPAVELTAVGKVFGRGRTAVVALEGVDLRAGPGEVVCLAAEADVRVGGRYRILMRSPDGEHHDVGGVYREIEPNRKLVFSWGWKSTPERESRVTVELRAIDTGTEMVTKDNASKFQ